MEGKRHVKLRRRPFLVPVWLFVLLGVLALGAAAWAVVAASTTLVVVARHAEKGDGDDPGLVAAGEARAGRLAELFGSRGRDLAIDAIVVSERRRTALTAEPLSARLGVPVVAHPADDPEGLARRVLAEYRGGRVLVVAHSNTVPRIVRALARGGSYPDLADDDFSTAYVVAVPRFSRPAVLRIALP